MLLLCQKRSLAKILRWTVDCQNEDGVSAGRFRRPRPMMSVCFLTKKKRQKKFFQTRERVSRKETCISVFRKIYLDVVYLRPLRGNDGEAGVGLIDEISLNSRLQKVLLAIL